MFLRLKKMVAVADVIKKMRADGMTREQIIDSLNELGFPNAEALYDKNAGAGGAGGVPKPQAPAPKPFGLAEAAEKEEKEETEEKEAEETEETQEAGEGKEKPLFQPAKKKENEEETREAQTTEEPPELKITQVGDDGLEKTVSIEDMLTKAEGAGAANSSKAGYVAASDSTLRAKLEETNALLRALADVNKKILETDREVLMRLKAKETPAAQSSQSAKT